MNNLSETPTKKNFTLNGETITSIAQFEQVLDNMHLPCLNISPCKDLDNPSEEEMAVPLVEMRDYANLRTKFLEQISLKSDGLPHSSTICADAGQLICTAGSSSLHIQYFPEGTALIAWIDTYSGLIYYFVNHDDALYKLCPEKEMVCQDAETLKNILLYFYETAEKNPNYHWIEDFSYTGSGGWHRDWMKESLMAPFSIPEEQSESLKKLRKAQESGEWQWGTPWSRKDYWRGAVCWENSAEMAALEQLTRIALSDDADPNETIQTPSFDSPEQQEHDILLRQTAKRLMSEKEFTRRESGIRDLCFLRNCGHLRRLDLRCNDVSDLSPLASLHQLKELVLDYNLISDLSPLEGLEQLRQLWLMGNKIRSLEPLRGLHNLNALHLRGNPLDPGTLASLRKCRRLGSLDLSHTGVQDISGLEYCRAWSLNLYGNPGLTGLEVIATMKNLSCLDLNWETARRYDIPALAPRLSEHARYGDHVQYVWPQKYFDD